MTAKKSVQVRLRRPTRGRKAGEVYETTAAKAEALVRDQHADPVDDKKAD